MPQTDQFGGILLDEEKPQTDQFGGIVLDHESPTKAAAPSPKLAVSPADTYAALKGRDIQIPKDVSEVPATGETLGQELAGVAMDPLIAIPSAVGKSDYMKKLAASMINAPMPITGGASISPQKQITPEQAESAAGVLAGVYNTAKGLPEFMESPLGMLTAGAGMLPKLAQKAIALPFAATMARGGAQALGEASVTGDPQQITEGALALAGAGLLGAHAGRPEAPKSPTKFPVTMREIQKGVPDASQVSEAAKIHGDVRPQQEPAGALPVKESVPGVQPQAGGRVPEAEKSEVPLKEAGQKVADDFGMRFDGQQMGRWLFTLFDESGKEGTSIVTKAGATPEQIKAKYEAKRAEYGDQPNAPRPPKEISKGPLEFAEGDTQPIEGSKGRSNITDAFVQRAVPKLDSVKSWMAILDRVTKGDIPPTNAAEKIGLALRAEGKEAMPKLRAAAQAYQAAKKIAAADLESPDPAKQDKAMSVLSGSIQVLSEAVEAAVKGNKSDWYDNRTKLPGIELDPSDASLDAFDNIKKFRLENQLKVEGVKALDPQSGKPLTATEALARKLGSETMAPQESDLAPGPGAQTVGEAPKPELAQLTDALKTLSEGKGKPQMAKAYDLGEELAKGKDMASRAISGLKAAGEVVHKNLQGTVDWNGLKAALGERQAELTESTQNARKFADNAMRGVPDKTDQAAISNYVDAGGDDAIIQQNLINTKPAYKRAYMRARRLPNDLKTVAENVRNYMESRLQDAQDAGILEDGVENYLHRIYEKDDAFKQGAIAEIRSGVFTGRPGFAKQRLFQYDAEAEAAGLKPEKNFAKRVAIYDMALNKAIADRKMVKQMMDEKMSDIRPAIDIAGKGIPLENQKTGERDATLIKPKYKPGDESKPNFRGDYIPYDHPALRKYKWVENDAAGKPILVQGDVLVHPEAVKQIDAIFGKSKVREYAIGRGMLAVGSTVKQTMLDLSGFHLVQITVHGWEHRTFKPVKEIDLQDPQQRALVSHGLVAADTQGHQLFSEGLAGSSLTKYIPYLGPKAQALNQWLFQSYIPRLKMAMALHTLERNRIRFADDLKFGKMTEDQLYHRTANEGNAAFGELNYEMLGRNKTTRDMMRIVMLAPDFFEARGRFAGQAFQKGAGDINTAEYWRKGGPITSNEQRQALLYGAFALYMTARIVNKLLNGQYHFEPKNAFSIIYNNKAYSLRTVQGDLLHLVTDPVKFFYSRLNPVFGRTALEAGTGRDAFGRKRDPLEQVQDLAKTIVPISLRGLLDKREQTLLESFLNAMGVTERRDTANDEVYRLAQKWKEKHGVGQPGEFIYDPEKDPYRRIKLALVFDTPEAAAQEMSLAIKNGKTDWPKMAKYFQRYGRTAFTGSRRNDQEFYASLSDDEKASFQKALKEREKIRTNLGEAFQAYRNNFSTVK